VIAAVYQRSCGIAGRDGVLAGLGVSLLGDGMSTVTIA
jgi:hypothetical protein